MKDISNLPDEKVASLVRSKDKELYSEIIKRYEAKLLRYVNYLISDEPESADVVQNTFIKAYINLNGFNIKKKFSSWLYRIAHNETINMINKQRKQITLSHDFDIESGIDLEDEIILKELKSHTRNCLQQIPVKYSEPLVLYYLEEKSYEEISDVLRVPIGTVGTRINRAKKLMKKICER